MSTLTTTSSCNDAIYNAVGIFLVSAGTGGDRLLFRYPVDVERSVEPRRRSEFLGKNYYAVRITEDYQVQSKPQQSSIQNGVLVGYQDKDLANLLAVKTNMCSCKFEVKINDVIFVGYPVTLETVGNKRELSVLSVHVVFALTASVSSDVIACYCDLSKQIALALLHEEKRVGYLSAMKDEMWRYQDDLASQPNSGKHDNAYAIMLRRKCRLALQLQAIFDSVCETGTVHVYINGWVAVNFALPHKIHDTAIAVTTRQKRDIVDHCIKVLRPYHAMLLLMSSTDILASLPLDSSPSLMRLIKVYQLVCHLVYWGHAIIIYPLCETNVYMLSVHVDSSPHSSLAHHFAEAFPQVSLIKVMADFSLPQPLAEHTVLRHDKLVAVVIWLLQRRVLAQLHKYIFFVPHTPKVVRSRGVTDSEQAQTQRSFSEWSGGHRTVIEALLGNQRTVTESGSSHLSLPLPRTLSDCTSVHSDESGMASTADDGVSVDEGLVRQQLNKIGVLDRQAVLGVAAAHSTEDLALFLRLLQYMNGEHHLEEIMYYENMRRSQLTTVLDKFRDVIVTCEHADLGLNP